MTLNLNKVTLAGRLTRDPELRNTTNSVVVKFAIAINQKYKSGDTLKEETTFIDCEAWGRTAELVGQYLKKGSGVFLEGRLKLDEWKTKDGQPRQTLKVVAENVQFAGDKPSPAAPSAAVAPTEAFRAPVPAKSPDFDDDFNQPPF